MDIKDIGCWISHIHIHNYIGFMILPCYQDAIITVINKCEETIDQNMIGTTHMLYIIHIDINKYLLFPFYLLFDKSLSI